MGKYIKKETKGQILFIVLIILAIVIGLIWNAMEDLPEYKWEASISYPMANANISWLQTHHSGGWGESNAGA